MLILKRRAGERILIGEAIITILGCSRNSVRVGIEAPARRGRAARRAGRTRTGTRTSSSPPQRGVAGGLAVATEPAEKERIEQLPLDAITEQIQMRVSMSPDAIADYAELLRKKDAGGLPPVQAIRDGDGRVYVWDGNHTIAAARSIGQRSVAAAIARGTREDAVLQAAGANREHGLRRSHADLRNTVKTLLNNAKWAKRSDRWLAKTVGCSQYVRRQRASRVGTVNG